MIRLYVEADLKAGARFAPRQEQAHYLVRVMWALLKRGTVWEEGAAPAAEPKGATPAAAIA